MAAALHCFARDGYDATRIVDIARESGLSDAALYVHFSSVQALAQELYLAHMPPFAQALHSAGENHAASVGERAITMVRVILATYRNNPDAFRFVLNRLPTFLGDVALGAPLPLATVTALVAEGQEAHIVRPGEPRVIAAMFLGSILRVVTLDEFGDLHGFHLTEEHDPTIIAAALSLLGIEGDTH